MIRSLAHIINLPALNQTAENTIENFCLKYGESHL